MLYHILGQALTGSELRLHTYPGLVLDHILDCVHVQISLLSDEVSRSVDTGIEERSQLKEDIGVVRVLIIAHREYFTNNHIIIYLTLNL